MHNLNSNMEGIEGIDVIEPVQRAEIGQQVEYFEIKDQRYIDELKVLLSKLRRYRWLYRRSSEYFDRVNDIYCYYPILVISALVAIGSFVTANIIKESTKTAEAITYVVGILGILSGIIQKYQTKQDYPTKKIKFETAAGEVDILVTRVSGEIKFPNENPQDFVVEIENEIIKIKNDLKYQIPLHIISEYNKLRQEHPSEISSEHDRIPPMNPNDPPIPSKTNFKLNCYDIDIEDDIKAQQTYENKQKQIMQGSYSNNGTVIQPYQVQSSTTSRRTLHQDFLRRTSLIPKSDSYERKPQKYYPYNEKKYPNTFTKPQPHIEPDIEPHIEPDIELIHELPQINNDINKNNISENDSSVINMDVTHF
jgi:hypothetical protein